MKIITLNINGIRSGIAKGFVEYVEQQNPDVVCLQEIKANQEDIPVFEFQALGYHTHWFSAKKKGYSGTAILSKFEPDRVEKGMNMELYDNEGRFMRVDYGNLSFVSVYHPSGSSGEERQRFKMNWLDDFHEYVNELRKYRPNLIISGDFNICHRNIDIHDPVRNKNVSGFLPEERQWMENFFDDGFVDTFRHVNKEPHHYTWWSFRANARQKNLGWRIDYNVVSNNLIENIKSAKIDSSMFFSDHCPVILDLNI
jgi:exodeoxyribonuclease III